MIFEPCSIGRLRLRNRMVRAATYEGMSDDMHLPTAQLANLYADLACGGAGAIITGFCFTSPDGMAMQSRQCSIADDSCIEPWRKIVQSVKDTAPDCPMVMQIAHTGRQTLPRMTGHPAIAPSPIASNYFKIKPLEMTVADIDRVISDFGHATRRAKTAGFDGVEIHAAHGYLIHQFLSPAMNHRSDEFGQDRFLFLKCLLAEVRTKCGPDFPILVKLSAADSIEGGITPDLACEYVCRLAECDIDGIEVSFGSMDEAMNIFRGGIPVDRVLKHNPLFCDTPAFLKTLWKKFAFSSLSRSFLPFTENYNRDPAREIRKKSGLPVLLTGGVRSLKDIEEIIASGDADAMSLCRPFIHNPAIVDDFRSGRIDRSGCINCNACAVMCDSREPLQCYFEKGAGNE